MAVRLIGSADEVVLIHHAHVLGALVVEGGGRSSGRRCSPHSSGTLPDRRWPRRSRPRGMPAAGAAPLILSQALKASRALTGSALLMGGRGGGCLPLPDRLVDALFQQPPHGVTEAAAHGAGNIAFGGFGVGGGQCVSVLIQKSEAVDVVGKIIRQKRRSRHDGVVRERG